jgi:hypothetical protein
MSLVNILFQVHGNLPSRSSGFREQRDTTRQEALGFVTGAGQIHLSNETNRTAAEFGLGGITGSKGCPF